MVAVRLDHRRNSFQRKKADALKFLATGMGIYAGTQK
jgi:hypothetical protein